VEAIKVHHLAPRCNKVLHERLLTIAGRVDLGNSTELRVGSEDEIDDGQARLPADRIIGCRLSMQPSTILERDIRRYLIFGVYLWLN